jgi:hypothetical protein
MFFSTDNVVPAWTTARDGGSAARKQELAPLAGIQKPRMASALYIHVAWIPAIHAGIQAS